jgi:hypothetical protein
MKRDRQGLPMTASAAGVTYYDDAVASLLAFRFDLVEAVRLAVSTDPSQPMARIFSAYLRLLSTEPAEVEVGRLEFANWYDETDRARFTDREQAHVAAVAAWLNGDLLGAGRLLRRLSVDFPRDVLALSVGHQIDFFSGDATTLRDRIGDALPAWSPSDPAYSYLLGMYAFGLEESGDYGRSEEVGRRAVDLAATDVWGIHAVVHTYEMLARVDDGLRFLDERVEEFDGGNFFRVHSWWHYCLFALEAGRSDLTLSVFDTVLRPPGPTPTAMELLDATALLWRLLLEGSVHESRFVMLSDDWMPLTEVPHYAFNDVHACMAHVGAGRLETAEALVADRARYLQVVEPSHSNALFTSEVGLPVCRALVSFGRGRYDEVLEQLLPIRHRLHLFGGSHAQRDAIERTLLEAALRGGSHGVARTLINERVERRPDSPYVWRKLASLERTLGSVDAAAVDLARAETLTIDAPSFGALSTLAVR